MPDTIKSVEMMREAEGESTTSQDSQVVAVGQDISDATETRELPNGHKNVEKDEIPYASLPEPILDTRDSIEASIEGPLPTSAPPPSHQTIVDATVPGKGHISSASFARTVSQDMSWAEDETDVDWNLQSNGLDPFGTMPSTERTNSFPQVPPAHSNFTDSQDVIAEDQAANRLNAVEKERTDMLADNDTTTNSFLTILQRLPKTQTISNHQIYPIPDLHHQNSKMNPSLRIVLRKVCL